VFIGGVDIREIPLARLRGAIGFVPQEPFLFSATVGENVAFGATDEQATDAHRSTQANQATDPHRSTQLDLKDRGKDQCESVFISGKPGPVFISGTSKSVTEAASVARLDKDVAEFPRGFETMVGERGITLSGGQKQRTALARAVMIDPKILILDDSLSAVDTYTEEEILSRLRGVMRQRTSIIVSHRISTVREANQIFVLQDGRVAERGTHDALVARNGLYATMYRKQLLEEELQAS